MEHTSMGRIKDFGSTIRKCDAFTKRLCVTEFCIMLFFER